MRKHMANKILLITALTSTFLVGCTASNPHTAGIERKHYGDWEKDVGYTQVVRIGNTLYLAGLGGEGETQAEQINSTYQTIKNILADYNATTSDIVKEVIYTTNIDELIAAKTERKKHFENNEYPASTWVQIERLYSPDMKVEIDVTVQIPQKNWQFVGR